MRKRTNLLFKNSFWNVHNSTNQEKYQQPKYQEMNRVHEKQMKDVIQVQETSVPKPVLLLPVLLGGLIFFSLLYFYTYSPGIVVVEKENQKLEELALGDDTKSYYATIDGYPIHCREIDDADDCLIGWKHRGNRDAILWLGNSQLHAINQMKDGDENAAKIVHMKMDQRQLDLLAFSQPNASLQEHFVMFSYLIRHLSIKLLILPLVFDDTRETGIRTGIAEAYEDPDVSQILSESKIGQSLIEKESPGVTSNEDFTGVRETVQESVESTLNRLLAKHLLFWGSRPGLRGDLYVGLYRFRNFMLGINPQSKRKLLSGRYQKNMEALIEILRLAKNRKIKVLAYIAPIRDDVEIPYVPEEYLRFKNETEKLVHKWKAFFVNIEGIVPARFWGTKASTTLDGKDELDFMHFQAEGHKLLAQSIEKNVIKYIIGEVR
jgi:hypothetical protein